MKHSAWALAREWALAQGCLLQWYKCPYTNSYHMPTSETVHVSKKVWDDLLTFVLAIVLNVCPRCSEAFVDQWTTSLGQTPNFAQNSSCLSLPFLGTLSTMH